MIYENSRYFGLEPLKYDTPETGQVAYLPRRFLPAVEPVELIALHALTDGERLDNITARYFEDPELFWWLCDANRAMYPGELTARGRRLLKIPLPQ